MKFLTLLNMTTYMTYTEYTKIGLLLRAKNIILQEELGTNFASEKPNHN